MQTSPSLQTIKALSQGVKKYGKRDMRRIQKGSKQIWFNQIGAHRIKKIKQQMDSELMVSNASLRADPTDLREKKSDITRFTSDARKVKAYKLSIEGSREDFLNFQDRCYHSAPNPMSTLCAFRLGRPLAPQKAFRLSCAHHQLLFFFEHTRRRLCHTHTHTHTHTPL